MRLSPHWQLAAWEPRAIRDSKASRDYPGYPVLLVSPEKLGLKAIREIPDRLGNKAHRASRVIRGIQAPKDRRGFRVRRVRRETLVRKVFRVSKATLGTQAHKGLRASPVVGMSLPRGLWALYSCLW
jgi:hypothetical protein